MVYIADIIGVAKMIENINNRLIKDTFFLFERLGFEVYLDSTTEPVLLISLPRCNDCGNPWYFNISQCFFCGAIAPFIMKDDKNDKYISSTNASAHRFYPCINPDCLSNKNSISDMIKSKYNGVFDRKSPFHTTLENCIKCGNDSYMYDTALIKIELVNEENYQNNKNSEYDGRIIRFYQKKKIELCIDNDKSLLKIFKELANQEMSEENFKTKIQKITGNPESFSFDNY